MRKILVSAAAAVSALAFAAPAAAQYYPAPPPPPYGHAYGYHNSHGAFRSLQIRIDRLEWQINRLDRVNAISDWRADRLRFEANDLERRLRFAARNGLSYWEANDIERRIGRLEQRVQYASVNRGYNQYGQNDWTDRDRDGRHDRWEDDRGRDHDGRWRDDDDDD